MQLADSQNSLYSDLECAKVWHFAILGSIADEKQWQLFCGLRALPLQEAAAVSYMVTQYHREQMGIACKALKQQAQACRVTGRPRKKFSFAQNSTARPPAAAVNNAEELPLPSRRKDDEMAGNQNIGLTAVPPGRCENTFFRTQPLGAAFKGHLAGKTCI